MSLKGKIFYIFLIISATCYSQSPQFKHITSAEGISQSEVYSILEDSRGFIWFGTVDGLNRYDGYRITVYNTDKNNPNSLTNNTIRCLAEDTQRRIWIGTDDGLSLYEPETELIYKIKVTGFENTLLTIYSILIDGNRLFLGTSCGLIQTEIQSRDILAIESGFQVIKNIRQNEEITKNIISIKKSYNGSIWVLCPSCVSRIIVQPNSNRAIIIEEQSSNDVIFRNIEEDRSGNLWVITQGGGLIRYITSSKQSEKFTTDNTNYSISSNKCSSMVFDQDGNLWIGTLDKGLNFLRADLINQGNIQFEHIQSNLLNLNSLNSNLISSLYVSINNKLWVGTIGSGVDMFDPQQKRFRHFRIQLSSSATSFISNFVRSVYADRKDCIWIGTHNNGLFIFDRKTETSQKIGFETQAIFFISAYKEDKIFICSSNGIYLVQRKGNRLNTISQLNTGAIFNITKSKNDTYWFATLNGLIRAKIINNQFVYSLEYTTETEPAISNNKCRVLLYDQNKDELLVGTEGGGLNIVALDDNQFAKSITFYKKGKESNSISSNYVRSIITDSKKNTWIGTFEGLNKMIQDPNSDKISFQSFNLKEGLPNNMIQLITEDKQGNLWIGTNGGLSKFDYQNNQFTNYTAGDGIQSNEFSEHTVFNNIDGEIIMGGINGITTFYPEKIVKSKLKPKTTITDFYLFNKKVHVNEKIGRKAPLTKGITITDTIVLLPRQNNIRFDFSAMLFSNPEKVQYAHMLEGFDKEWNYTDAMQRTAAYTNLKHGKYVFKVKSTNNDGIWEDTSKNIFIHIKTPFVYTWIAYLVYLLIIIVLFKYFANFSVIRYTTKKRIFFENEHNQKLHELDILRTKFFINISHDLRTPITLISEPLAKILKTQNLKSELKPQLELISRNVKRLKYLVEQLLDIRKAEAGKLQVKLQLANIVDFAKEEAAHFDYAIKNKGLLLNVISNESSIIANFDPDMMSKMIFNLLSNAVKHTNKGEITIRIDKVINENVNSFKNTQFIKIEVQDTGQGIAEDKLSRIFERFFQDETKMGKGYGIGLSHCKELVEAHSGSIEVNSTQGVGTVIRFYIPDTELPDEQHQKQIATDSSTEDFYIETVNPHVDNPILQASSSAKTVLVVEDNADMRIFIKNELVTKFKVYEAKDGIEGLELAEEHLPDLIVSDIMMPNMDGIEFCKQLKTNITTSHIPVILLTARVDRVTKYQSIETGADDYISKPFEIEYLLLRITNLLKTREQLRKLFQKNSSIEPSVITITSLDEKFLSSLIATIEKGIPDPDFNVSLMESEMGMSHANFYRKIRSITGQSGKELLQNMRMKRAYQLLSENKNIRVSDVAYLVGFTEPKYFSRCFKDKYGKIPSKFKE